MLYRVELFCCWFRRTASLLLVSVPLAIETALPPGAGRIYGQTDICVVGHFQVVELCRVSISTLTTESIQVVDRDAFSTVETTEEELLTDAPKRASVSNYSSTETCRCVKSVHT